MRKLTLFQSIGALAALLMVSGAQASSITFSDSVFNDADWAITVLSDAPGFTGTAFQSTADGGGFGGASDTYRRVEHTWGVIDDNVVTFHQKLGATYDPSTQGAIDSIDYKEDARRFLPSSFGDGHATGPAIRQNGNIYITFVGSQGGAWAFTPETSWTLKELTATESSFFLSTNASPLSGSGSPDFSASGSIMDIGFWRGNSGGGISPAGIDNWEFTIVQAVIPVPASVLLFGSALGLLGWIKRKAA